MTEATKEQTRKRPLVVLTGPTAVGKTQTSIRLAKAIGGEIISADSMQVYKHMDIGSAKITKEEMEGVPHFLIDVMEPTENFNIVTFQTLAKQAMEEIYERGHIPIIVGGTGFYIQSVVYDVDFTESDEDTVFRKKMEDIAKTNGNHYLHEMLRKVDPAAAEKIHENNVKRVIRALEFFEQTHQKISEHNETQLKKESPYNTYYFVLNCERKLLYERIDKRVDSMVECGLVDEVKALQAMGLTRQNVSMQGLGYKEILDYLDGNCSLEEAVDTIKLQTRHFAKRQIIWFRRERNVIWVKKEDYDFDTDRIVSMMVQRIQEMQP